MAEKERFELSTRDKPCTPLAGERLRPLGHFSIFFNFFNIQQAGISRRRKDTSALGLGKARIIKKDAFLSVFFKLQLFTLKKINLTLCLEHLFINSMESPMASASARHLLVTTEEQCNDIKKQIEEGADFAAMAQQHSSCPSKAQGGDLGAFGPGQMVPEFDAVVFSAPLNTVQGPVKTQFGYHLLEVTSRTD